MHDHSRAIVENTKDAMIAHLLDGSSGNITIAEKEILRSKAGMEKTVANSLSPIRDREGTTIGTAIVFRDITAQTSLEESLVKAQKLEAIGRLAGSLAHDFNIMTALLGNVGLLKIRSSTDEAAMARLEKAEMAINKTMGLTGRPLTFSMGGAPIKRVTSPPELVRYTVDFAMAGSNVRAHDDLTPDLFNVEADPQQISQVLNNIIVILIEAMTGGGNIHLVARNIVLDQTNPHSPPSGEYVEIMVIDDGPGMPPDVVAKIFEPFFTTKSKGNGPSLYISYSVIKNPGGSIDIASRQGGWDLLHHRSSGIEEGGAGYG